MTEEQKRAVDDTRWIVVEMSKERGSSGAIAFSVVFTDAAEPQARAEAERRSLANPGTRYGLFQKAGVAFAEMKVDWKGAAS